MMNPFGFQPNKNLNFSPMWNQNQNMMQMPMNNNDGQTVADLKNILNTVRQQKQQLLNERWTLFKQKFNVYGFDYYNLSAIQDYIRAGTSKLLKQYGDALSTIERQRILKGLNASEADINRCAAEQASINKRIDNLLQLRKFFRVNDNNSRNAYTFGDYNGLSGWEEVDGSKTLHMPFKGHDVAVSEEEVEYVRKQMQKLKICSVSPYCYLGSAMYWFFNNYELTAVLLKAYKQGRLSRNDNPASEVLYMCVEAIYRAIETKTLNINSDVMAQIRSSISRNEGRDVIINTGDSGGYAGQVMDVLHAAFAQQVGSYGCLPTFNDLQEVPLHPHVSPAWYFSAAPKYTEKRCFNCKGTSYKADMPYNFVRDGEYNPIRDIHCPAGVQTFRDYLNDNWYSSDPFGDICPYCNSYGNGMSRTVHVTRGKNLLFFVNADKNNINYNGFIKRPLFFLSPEGELYRLKTVLRSWDLGGHFFLDDYDNLNGVPHRRHNSGSNAADFQNHTIQEDLSNVDQGFTYERIRFDEYDKYASDDLANILVHQCKQKSGYGFKCPIIENDFSLPRWKEETDQLLNFNGIQSAFQECINIQNNQVNNISPMDVCGQKVPIQYNYKHHGSDNSLLSLSHSATTINEPIEQPINNINIDKPVDNALPQPVKEWRLDTLNTEDDYRYGDNTEDDYRYDDIDLNHDIPGDDLNLNNNFTPNTSDDYLEPDVNAPGDDLYPNNWNTEDDYRYDDSDLNLNNNFTPNISDDYLEPDINAPGDDLYLNNWNTEDDYRYDDIDFEDSEYNLLDMYDEEIEKPWL